MFDKDIIEKINNLKCSSDELYELRVDTINYDLEDPFEKYYSCDKIIKVIEKYQNGEIDDKYLSHWANLYNWILNGGFKDYVQNQDKYKDKRIEELNEILKFEISDWLDSLSFFDSNEEEEMNIKVYKESFKNLDYIYNTINDWKTFYTIENKQLEGYDILIPCINDKTKNYIIINYYIDNLDEIKYINNIEFDEYKQIIQELIQKGYEEIKYGFYE